MARKCSVCGHPDRDMINKSVVDGAELRGIARTYGLSEDAVTRHKASHLPAYLVQAKAAVEVAQADSLVAELRRIMQRAGMLFDACDRWLRDPEHPERYDIGPRAEDVHVIYEEREGNKFVRRKARLSTLLPKVEEDNDITVKVVEVKHADPRKLLLEASGRLANQLELLAKLLGELQEHHTVNILVSPEWIRVRSVIVETLQAYPDARFAVAEALGKIGYVNGSARS